MTVLRSEALRSLKPWAEYVWYGQDWSGLNWLDTVQKKPTEEEVDAEVIRLTQLEIDNAYQEKRLRRYPSIGDQLDDLYHQGFFSAEMTAKLKKVKDDNPKPGL